MRFNVFAKAISRVIGALFIILLPLSCMAYVEGDINSDNKIGLEETIYSLKVAAGAAIPLSGNTIEVPSQIPTIQQAIDAASDGDTINIAAGTYNEALTIDGKVLVLSGAGSASTIIDGTIATIAENAITIEHSPGVAINNLTVQNGNKGIYAINNAHVEIEQVVVKDCADRGIQIDTNSNAEIINTTLNTNGRDGIGVLRNSNVYISGNITLDDNLRHGIHLFLGSTALIDEASLTGTGNVSNGFSVNHNSSLYINATTINITDSVNAMEASSGSTYGVSADSTVTVTTCGQNGIGVYGASRLYSEGLITVQGAAGDGLVAAGNGDVVLKGDVSIADCGTTGLGLYRSSSSYISAKLEILRTGDYGIVVAQGSVLYNRDTANIIVKETTGEGMGIGLYGNAIFRANGGTLVIQDNLGTGIEAARNSTISLRNKGAGLNANISNNATGIMLTQQCFLRTDAGLTVSGNSVDGIGITQGSDATIRGVVVENNGRWGIDVNDGASINVSSSSIIQSNTTGDISLLFKARSSIYSSTVGNMVCEDPEFSRGDVVCPVIQ